mgnify:CR=1 FL=1
MIGEDKLNKLKKASVIVFGAGGVGGYTVECLARSNIGKIAVVDNDTVSESNINRQIIATRSSIGKYKVDVMKEYRAVLLALHILSKKNQTERYLAALSPHRSICGHFLYRAQPMIAINSVNDSIIIAVWQAED